MINCYYTTSKYCCNTFSEWRNPCMCEW